MHRLENGLYSSIACEYEISTHSLALHEDYTSTPSSNKTCNKRINYIPLRIIISGHVFINTHLGKAICSHFHDLFFMMIFLLIVGV